MSKLPFVVEPRLKPIIETIGSEESGQIEVERRGYISAGEKAFTSNGNSTDRTSEMVLSTVRRVSTKYKIDSKEAYELVTGTITGEVSELSEKLQKDFTTELGEIMMSAIASNERARFLKAFCILLYRVDGSITAEEAMTLHPDLLDGLAALYDEEEARSVERLRSAVEKEVENEVEDAAKK